MIEHKPFGDYALYTISTEELSLSVCDLGATAVSLRFRGRELILGYDSPEAYLAGQDYLGAAVGRYANRIGGASFPLNGRRVSLPANDGENTLHGGPGAFDKRRWDAEITGDDAVRFTLLSPDGDNGFPGALRAAVTYRLEGAALTIEFEGESDRDTVFAPTSHLYFDLAGTGRVLEAELRIAAARCVEPGPGLIPTGRLLPAEGDLDFRSPRPVGRDLDHAFVLDSEKACTLRAGGLRMELETDFPALQVYTGAFLHAPHAPRSGLALEPEFFPDSPNHPDFPSTLLRPGELFRRRAVYRFFAEV